ncbi:hypothetical protein DL766_009940 [Monosporascus sp. MC13-8B]|uniref:Plastocyanin-like domain-containing protein n=1 Tax=Monosporascus cannonballus TaxID=155416 RepID=A0ABY0HCW3_9PEZI|nr:hypothetical protein DL762_004098 [Monosporascus cannonballus]RYO94380.1 hypothetical protein DL763_004096 [Monosporascus cannonballus]RYP12684.1 hypothetical protein DL766_009940 [Monosporascus sp. MC13-8B]
MHLHGHIIVAAARGLRKRGSAARLASPTNSPITDFLILERNDYVGRRVRSAPFGARPDDGTPYTVELGANWV